MSSEPPPVPSRPKSPPPTVSMEGVELAAAAATAGTDAATADATSTTLSSAPSETGAAPAAVLSIDTATAPLKARGRGAGRSLSPTGGVPMDAHTQSALAQAGPACAAAGLHGLAGLLKAAASSTSQASLASKGPEGAWVVSQLLSPPSTNKGDGAADFENAQQHAALTAAVQKALAEAPPWVHWSKTDVAPGWRVAVDSATRLKLQVGAAQLRGSCGGYRMARASHGVHHGTYYFECLVLPGPTAREIRDALPAGARLGPALQQKLQAALEWEDEQEEKKDEEPEQQEEAEPSPTGNKKRKRPSMTGSSVASVDEKDAASTEPPQVGGHVRLGWSMRTGDLQAPVGYDRWSFAIRDELGSIVHKSQRQDSWGGQGFTAGDVVGCAISLDEAESLVDAAATAGDGHTNNEIRFFKNGQAMGQFYITKGKREGGQAFTDILPGTYYPAVSTYMGGGVVANFGPHWICPPRKLVGLTKQKLKPLQELCPLPLQPEQAVTQLQATAKLFTKPEQQEAFRQAVAMEAALWCRAHDEFLDRHVRNVRHEREERGVSLSGLPEVEEEGEKMSEADGAAESTTKE